MTATTPLDPLGSPELQDLVPAEVLGDILGDLVESLFGPEEPRPFSVPAGEPADPVGATISIAGGWNGDLALRTSRRLAEQVAARLFLLPEGSAGDSDVLDVLGEIVNVVGGNVKALLPGPNSLSLPRARLDDVTPPEGGVRLVLRWGPETVQLFMASETSSDTTRTVEGDDR